MTAIRLSSKPVEHEISLQGVPSDVIQYSIFKLDTLYFLLDFNRFLRCHENIKSLGASVCFLYFIFFFSRSIHTFFLLSLWGGKCPRKTSFL